eukprot:14951483-Alexandrium_andersonii.AAC.1
MSVRGVILNLDRLGSPTPGPKGIVNVGADVPIACEGPAEPVGPRAFRIHWNLQWALLESSAATTGLSTPRATSTARALSLIHI